MKNFFSVLTILAVVAALNIFSQTAQEATLADGLKTGAKFQSLEGRFEIALTPRLSGYDALTREKLGFEAAGKSFGWRFRDGAANVSFYDYLGDAPPAQTEAGRRNFFAGFRDGTLKQSNAKLISEKPLAVGGGYGWQIDFQTGEVKGTRRVLLIGKRAYLLTVVFKPEIAGVETTAAQVLNSFRFFSQAEAEQIAQRQLAAATPSLPQTPVVRRATSDAADDNLKGRVKQIIEEIEYLSDDSNEKGRQPSKMTEYDETGNRVTAFWYSGGSKPSYIIAYGYIDGKRVSKSAHVVGESGLPPDAAVSGEAAKKSDTKPDLRYEYAYEYQYTDNRMSEMQMIFNDNRREMRYVYNLKGDEKTMLVYTTDGKLNSKHIWRLDADGNEIEELHHLPAYGDRKYAFTYEFDAQGNWIKKTTFKIEKGKDKSVPEYITYRRISYF